ncbi:hypothetical protein Q0Z83_029800 [Actinoplanes sichuanensis]|uniref:Uncharacterized protein n=1 Tax=Actinoplanes sichuanensis TaxID=512349 RepID=A0ABW4AWA7_9ACTN|nr:hypothetical protein [Actinoplanes sichuanensis]BEL04789.1 hypothetical protein Q0Z83_029800 [Actinoplanes sichuanensis]
MESVALDGYFRIWSYGVGHSQLLLHAHTDDDGVDMVSMLCEDVSAMKLRRGYRGLTIRTADEPTRTRLLGYAEVPDFRRPAQACLILPTEEDGFIVCGRARVLTGRQPRDQPSWRLPENARVLHVFPPDRG